MPWPVKVVAVVRRPGRTATGLRSVLAAAEAAFRADCATALATREPLAGVRWTFKAVALSATTYELYPKLELTLPAHENAPRPADPSAIHEKLALCRDAIVTRLQQLAATEGWTIQRMHTSRYGAR